jgi:hypothetical protein
MIYWKSKPQTYYVTELDIKTVIFIINYNISEAFSG